MILWKKPLSFAVLFHLIANNLSLCSDAITAFTPFFLSAHGIWREHGSPVYLLQGHCSSFVLVGDASTCNLFFRVNKVEISVALLWTVEGNSLSWLLQFWTELWVCAQFIRLLNTHDFIPVQIAACPFPSSIIFPGHLLYYLSSNRFCGRFPNFSLLFTQIKMTLSNTA